MTPFVDEISAHEGEYDRNHAAVRSEQTNNAAIDHLAIEQTVRMGVLITPEPSQEEGDQILATEEILEHFLESNTEGDLGCLLCRSGSSSSCRCRVELRLLLFIRVRFFQIIGDLLFLLFSQHQANHFEDP